MICKKQKNRDHRGSISGEPRVDGKRGKMHTYSLSTADKSIAHLSPCRCPITACLSSPSVGMSSVCRRVINHCKILHIAMTIKQNTDKI